MIRQVRDCSSYKYIGDGFLKCCGFNFIFLIGKSLIKHVLLQVEEFLYQENLTVEWASFPTQPTAAKAFPVKNAVGFHRVWSALSFLFCIVDGAGETATSSAGIYLFINFLTVK